MPFFRTSDGVKLHYGCKNLGSRKPLLFFVHGFVVCSEFFSEEISHFRREGYPMVWFDLRGHGLSGVPADRESFAIERFSKDISELRRHLGIRRKIVLIGHSTGGLISFYTAMHERYVSRLVVLNSTNRLPDRAKLVKSITGNHYIRSLYDSFMKNRKETPAYRCDLELQKSEKVMDSKTFFLKCLLTSDMATVLYVAESLCKTEIGDLSKLRTPFLILEGDRDEFISKREIARFRRRLPKGAVKVLHGHHDMALKMPEEVIRNIEAFLQKR